MLGKYIKQLELPYYHVINATLSTQDSDQNVIHKRFFVDLAPFEVYI